VPLIPTLFLVPEVLPQIERSKSVDHATIEYWLRFESEGVGDDPAGHLLTSMSRSVRRQPAELLRHAWRRKPR
jgi:hypothetical protein